MRDNREWLKRWRKERDKSRLSVKEYVVCSFLTQMKWMLHKLRYEAVRAEVRVFLHGQMRKAIDGLKKDGLNKKSIRLTNNLGAETWRYFCITDVTKVCWARCKWEGLWLCRAWPAGAGGGRKAQHTTSLEVQPWSETDRRKRHGIWTCVSD